jgi:hypothetical protein
MRFASKIGITICCASLVCGLVGWEVYRLRAHTRALSQAAEAYRKQAEQADANAEFELSSLYYYGTGVPEDYPEASRWARKAADQGLASADYEIGSWYYHGLGVPQNYSEAFRWYSVAAAKGDAAGQYGLGYMYRHGMGIKQDDLQAIGWIRRSAEQGYARAECELGYLYQKGYGVHQDYTQAADWYRRAANQGDAEAESGIGFMEFNGYGVAENRRDADQWFHKAAEQGDAYARNALGIVWLGMTTFQLVFFLVQIAGGLLLLISSLLWPQSRARFRSNKAPWAGCLCLVSAAIWWYGFNHYDIRSFNGGVNAFTSSKFLLDGIVIVMLVSVLRGARKQSLDSLPR